MLSPSNQTKAEFEALALPYLDQLYSAALRLTKNEKDAEDLVQDAFMRAYRFFDKFERGTNMKAWLFKIFLKWRPRLSLSRPYSRVHAPAMGCLPLSAHLKLNGAKRGRLESEP